MGICGARDYVAVCLHCHGKLISICRIQAVYAKELVCAASRQQRKLSKDDLGRKQFCTELAPGRQTNAAAVWGVRTLFIHLTSPILGNTFTLSDRHSLEICHAFVDTSDYSVRAIKNAVSQRHSPWAKLFRMNG